MQKKLSLKQADDYECRIATLYAVEAMLLYLDGKETCHRIGNEQGDIEEWDDVVMHGAAGSATHCQVKRNTGHFCTNKITREFKKSGEKKDIEKQELSPLDSAFSKLARHFSQPVEERRASKIFRLALPHGYIQIKKGLFVHHLVDVCGNWSKAGAILQDFSQANDMTAKIRNWLTSWCDFGSDEAMFDCLRSLEIRYHGVEAELDKSGFEKLQAWFDSPTEVWREIRYFIKENASVDHALTPRMIVCHVERFIRADRRAWTRYVMCDSSTWEVSGTLTGNGREIESPSLVVRRLWKPPHDRNFELQIGHESRTIASDRLNPSLLRLALHVATGVIVSAAEASAWQEKAGQLIRLTLGRSDSEFSELRWTNRTKVLSPADRREIRSITAVDEEAALLTGEMNAVTWSLVKKSVNDKISGLSPGEVRNAVDRLWCDWAAEIDLDPKSQHQFMSEMLYANVEGELALGTLRAGPRTVPLLSHALVMLLHLAIGCKGAAPRWDALGMDLSVRTVALLYWAGTKSQPVLTDVKRFFDVDESAERATFLGKETARVLVLPQSTLAESAVHASSLAGVRVDGDRFADARLPPSVVTYSMDFKRAMEAKTVSALEEYVFKLLQERTLHRVEHAIDLTTGEPHVA